MINAIMRSYDYQTFSDENDYGQVQAPAKDAEPIGSVKMAIVTTTSAIQDNIRYKDSTYLGLTSAAVTDKFLIKYGDIRLKVLYVEPAGRLKQVFMSEYD